MSSIYDLYQNLWPEASRKSLSELLSKIEVIHYPEEKIRIEKCSNPSKVVVVLDDAPIKDVVELAQKGFQHMVQRKREDFAQELLVSALMLVKPDAFQKNPLPFFFSGFKDPKDLRHIESNLIVPLKKSSDKRYILDRLEIFLAQHDKLNSISELCIQVADELIMNAFYSAPVDSTGAHPYQNLNRSVEVALPDDRLCRIFSCFSDHRVIIGCEDGYGSLAKSNFIDHIGRVFKQAQATPRQGETGGAGLGFKYMMENSANFYVFAEKDRRALFACGFLLKGLRANLQSRKHFHLSFS